MGEEAFERWQRDRELPRNPRPLTGVERAVLRQAAAPLLADLAASGMSLPDIREEAHEEREAPSVCGWIQRPGGTGEGICVLLDSPAAEQVAQLAEQFQHWAADRLHDAGRPPESAGLPAAPQPAAPAGPAGARWPCCLGVPGKRPGDLAGRRTGDARQCPPPREAGPPASTLTKPPPGRGIRSNPRRKAPGTPIQLLPFGTCADSRSHRFAAADPVTAGVKPPAGGCHRSTSRSVTEGPA